MRVLIAGCGVIGTVYGAHLGAAGHAVNVLSHPPRTSDVTARGLTARDVLTRNRAQTSAVVVPDAAAGCYDLVLVAVRADQLASACAELTRLQGAPAVLFFGNNPGGRAAIPDTVPGAVQLGFPGIGGVLRDGTADYARIRQQPTALQATPRPASLWSDRAPAQPGRLAQPRAETSRGPLLGADHALPIRGTLLRGARPPRPARNASARHPGDCPAGNLSRDQPAERAPAGCPALFAVKLSRTDAS
jgi:hypothetical protein